VELPDPALPTGVGIYTRRLSRRIHGTPRQAAQRASSHGLSFVCMASVWQDETGHKDLVPSAVEQDYAEAFREQGVKVWVWGYPDAGKEKRFAESITEHCRRLGGEGVLVDPEKPYKGKHDELHKMYTTLIDHMDEGMGLGSTSYGKLSWHNLEPVKRWGWGSPQVYKVNSEIARSAVKEWAKDIERPWLLPSIPTFGPNSGGALGSYIGAIEDLSVGVIAWSWRATSPVEWRALERWAKRFSP